MDDVINEVAAPSRTLRSAPTSTVGRGKAIVLDKAPTTDLYQADGVSLHFGDSLSFYSSWEQPTTIVSDGAYGVLGFEGDTSDHLDVPAWYEPHVKAWAEAARPNTTLWFWNSEIGWAAAHPIIEKHGWRYVNCNIWNKGVGHIAGNVNTQKIRRFPVVTEVCVQYVFEARIGGLDLKQWLLSEWKRSGLTLRRANEACGVKDAAVRKYLDQGHLWYFPPAEAMQRLSDYANEHGRPEGRPYFSLDGKSPVTGSEWEGMRSKFCCPHGVTNVWERNTVRGEERVKTEDGRAVHLNQKPLDLMSRIIEASTDVGDVIWEPFGGLFTGSLAASRRLFDEGLLPFNLDALAERLLDLGLVVACQQPCPLLHRHPVYRACEDALLEGFDLCVDDPISLRKIGIESVRELRHEFLHPRLALPGVRVLHAGWPP
ncbi:MAG: site-specific DNA-methyltransferase [Nitrospinae bacterium]|nr:site-specific DNA-methyltransferase [Nitrospinota bacterium]